MKRFRYFRFTLAAAGMALMALGGCTSRATKLGSEAERTGRLCVAR